MSKKDKKIGQDYLEKNVVHRTRDKGEGVVKGIVKLDYTVTVWWDNDKVSIERIDDLAFVDPKEMKSVFIESKFKNEVSEGVLAIDAKAVERYAKSEIDPKYYRGEKE